MNVTKFIKLFKPGYNETADIEILNQNSDKIDAQFEEQSKILAGKEPIITKKSGFNLDKTDEVENDSNKLFTPLGALNLKNWLVTNYTSLMNNIRETLDNKIGTKLAHGGYAGTGQTLFNLINGKENSFSKNSAFNKNFGTELGTVLEGAKLAETLGLEYGGIVNNNNAKTAGKAYYCTSNKAIYKCTQNNSLNYIDANYFEGLSNDKLLGKLQNLIKCKTEYPTNGILNKTSDSSWKFAIVKLCDIGTGYFWSAHVATNEQENWIVRYIGGPSGPLQRIGIYLTANPIRLRFESCPERTVIYSVTYFYFN